MQNTMTRQHDEVLRDGMYLEARILQLLAQEPQTIPGLTQALSLPSHEVTAILMTLWRFGRVVEVGKADQDGYYRYEVKS